MKANSLLITVLFICLSIGLALSACQVSTDNPSPDMDQGSAAYDIRGTWEYTMTASDGNTYDSGTITFSGGSEEGTYLQINIYDVDYDGEYQVTGTMLMLIGEENWQGNIKDANNMSGTWAHEEEGFSGTWTAIRQEP
jgi:hypothetical protein